MFLERRQHVPQRKPRAIGDLCRDALLELLDALPFPNRVRQRYESILQNGIGTLPLGMSYGKPGKRFVPTALSKKSPATGGLVLVAGSIELLGVARLPDVMGRSADEHARWFNRKTGPARREGGKTRAEPRRCTSARCATNLGGLFS